MEHELIDRNPFVKLKSLVVGNRDRDFFVTQEMAQKVLNTCPDAQWRLLFALSWFGGLRPERAFGPEARCGGLGRRPHPD